jgi:hypothetical protein
VEVLNAPALAKYQLELFVWTRTKVTTLMRVSLTISEPWEIGEAMNWRPMTGELLRTEIIDGRATALLQLDEPIVFEGNSWPYLVAVPRHTGHSLAEIHDGKSVSISMTAITAQQATSVKPCDLSRWRGGLACIAEVSLAGR